MGFTQGQVDNCVFVKDTRKRRIFVAIYVDDVLIADYAEKFKAVDMKEIRNLPPVESLDFGDDFLSREEAMMYRSLVRGLLYIAN